MLSASQRRFIEAQRTAILGTIGRDGTPRLVPICYALSPHAQTAAVLYTPLDEKPKVSGDVRTLARARDIERRADVTLLFDHWDEDWSSLGWLRLRGTGSLMAAHGAAADEHGDAVRALRSRYPQYVSHAIEAAPLIAIKLTSVTSWGSLDDTAAEGH